MITGATGMVGANLARRLVESGNRPVLLVRDPERLGRIESFRSQVDIVTADITDSDAVKATVGLTQPKIVYHLAGSFFNPPTLSAAEHMRINALGTLNLCEACKTVPGIRLVFAGSASVYAGGPCRTEDMALDPGSMFGVSKASGSMIVRTFGRLAEFETIELRLFGPYGPYENARRLIPDTILSALAGNDVCIGDGRQQRDFVYMDDVIDAFLLAATRTIPSGLTVNIASGQGRAIHDVAARVLTLMGDPVPLKTGSRSTRKDEIWEISGDITAARNHLGWVPKIDFDEGLRRTISWFAENRAMTTLLT